MRFINTFLLLILIGLMLLMAFSQFEGSLDMPADLASSPAAEPADEPATD